MVGKASAGSLNWVALRRRGWSVLMELSLLSIDVQAKWAGGGRPKPDFPWRL